MHPAAATRAGLQAWIAGDPPLAALLAAARDRAADLAHDVEHLLRVARWTLRLAPDEDPREAVAASLLHDWVALPKDHPERARAGERSAEAARPLLAAHGFAAEAIERIAGAIRDHGFSRGAVPETPLGCALQDADRLDALGAIGLWRAFATGALLGRPLYDPDDPLCERRAPDDGAWTLDHFHAKLLRLPATMQTATGRDEAERRAAVLRRYLADLAGELGVAVTRADVPG